MPMTVAERQPAHAIDRVPLPIEYEDGSVLNLLFRTSPDLASDFTRPVELEPILLAGRAVAMLTICEHRRTSIGPYGEVGVSILARDPAHPVPAWRALLTPAAAPAAGWLFVNLPVTTEIALDAGVEFWGFPKYRADIRTAFTDAGVKATLGSEIEIEHRAGFGPRLPGPPLVTMTVLRSQVIRTCVPIQYRVRYGGTRSARVRVLGEGPTAGTVRKLGLDRLRPFLAFRADAVRMSLPLGTPMAM